ncbi:hypothetical protein TIFTF001_028452 [Ficus carica]|uniref:Uncharacterized protein n=1 Tax=Ficus carica TaxID=3494 RepID=A0AA88DPU9_FICCA|nr:hypothetical protein TIFTF001_028452 [Ficus carica]
MDSTSSPLSQHKLDGAKDRRLDGDAIAPVDLATTLEDLDNDDDDYGICDRNRAPANSRTHESRQIASRSDEGMAAKKLKVNEPIKVPVGPVTRA